LQTSRKKIGRERERLSERQCLHLAVVASRAAATRHVRADAKGTRPAGFAGQGPEPRKERP